MFCRRLFCVEANRLNRVAASFSVPRSCLMMAWASWFRIWKLPFRSPAIAGPSRATGSSGVTLFPRESTAFRALYTVASRSSRVVTGVPRRLASACARRALSSSCAPAVVIESSYMLCPFGDLQKKAGEHRIVAAEHPLQIEIRAGERAGGPDIRKRERRTGYEWRFHNPVESDRNSLRPADQVAVHGPGGVGIQPDNLRHAINVERAGDEDARPRGVVPLARDVAQAKFILRAYQAGRHRALYCPVGEGQHGLQPGQSILPRLVRRVHQVLLEIVAGLIEVQVQATDVDRFAERIREADRHRPVDQHIPLQDQRRGAQGQH